MTDNNWSPQQIDAIDKVAKWLKDKDKQIFYIAGFAGTGKTTLAKHLASGVGGDVLFAAYTGKAASVLQKKGCPNASTIHKILYSVSEADKTRLFELEEQLFLIIKEPDYNPEKPTEEEKKIREEIKKERKKILRKPNFRFNEMSPIQYSSLIVLDECSMVNTQIAQDILSFKKPVLVLGDPAQLPPVRGGGFFTNRTPDVMLTEIHRQAEDNPILDFATAVRKGEKLKYCDRGRAKKISKHDVDDSLILDSGQILVGYNKTRRRINRKARALRGIDSVYPVNGDRLVILKNNYGIGVMNGVTCDAAENAVYEEELGELRCGIIYDGRYIPDIDTDPTNFLATAADCDPDEVDIDRYWDWFNAPQAMDYGYALTVHKAQGSQWPKVTVVSDGFGKKESLMSRRWLYTAITRAEEELVIIQ